MKTIAERLSLVLSGIHESTLIPSPILGDGITFTEVKHGLPYEQSCSVKLINGIQINMSWGPDMMSDNRSVEAWVVPQGGYEFPEDSFCMFDTPSYILVPGFGDDSIIPYLSIHWISQGHCVADLISAAGKMELQRKK
jgi:hypothetical protein